LFIAILMWYGVTHEPIAEISVRVPIEFIHPPKDLDYTSDTIPEAQVRLRGPSRVLRDLDEQDSVHVVIDLRGATSSEHTYDLNPEQVKIPRNVEVLQITPTRLRMSFDKSETRQVAIHARVVGTPPPGYGVESLIASPATLIINGPQHHVDAVDNALTDAVDITGLTGKSSFDTRAYLLDPLVHVVGSSAVRVTVVTGKSSSRTGAR
jgi:YbbR domain-containing protein